MICEHCGKLFGQKSNLTAHLRSFHDIIKKKIRGGVVKNKSGRKRSAHDIVAKKIQGGVVKSKSGRKRAKKVCHMGSIDMAIMQPDPECLKLSSPRARYMWAKGLHDAVSAGEKPAVLRYLSECYDLVIRHERETLDKGSGLFPNGEGFKIRRDGEEREADLMIDLRSRPGEHAPDVDGRHILVSTREFEGLLGFARG